MNFFNRQYRVLYAEDDEDNRDMVVIMCRTSEIEVVAAETVGDAWRLSQAEPFDLYLLDTRFPDGDGLELCRRLRAFAPRAPILIYSGNAYQIDKRNGLAAGADDYLTKPFTGNLAAVIRRNIEQPTKTARQTETIQR